MSLPDRLSDSTIEPRIGRSVSLDHAAELLGVSRRTIYNRIRDGRLQTIRTWADRSACCSTRFSTSICDRRARRFGGPLESR